MCHSLGYSSNPNHRPVHAEFMYEHLPHFTRVVSVFDMELSRRRLFVLGAASATVATAGLTVAPAAHADAQEQPLGHGTTYDQNAMRDNPDNKLGCPLGKGL